MGPLRPLHSLGNFSSAFIHAKLISQRLFFKWKQFVEKIVEGETSRIGERSIETISGDTSSGRQDLLNRYSAHVIRGQKIDVEKFDGKINFGMWRREVMDALIQIDLDIVLKNKRHLYDEEIQDRVNEKACSQIRSCLSKEVKYLVKDEECAVTLWHILEEKYLLKSHENCLHVMS